jgi:2-oxoisovalerate dehydrogenase E1 component
VNLNPYAESGARQLPSLSLDDVTPVQAINAALTHSLENDKDVFLLGEDIAVLGGPFKTTKGIFEQYGRDRIVDMPLAESGFTGFAVGAAEMGLRPVVEMQFSDFSTDAVTQIGVNSGTYYFRTGLPLPLTIRMPTGGGLSYGPFHSQDLEGLYASFPGLKIVYPSFPQDFFNLLLSSIYDENPVLVFESKYLHRRLKGDIRFDGSVQPLDGSRVVRPGEDVTVFSYGAMLHETLAAAESAETEMDISVEVIDGRVLKPFRQEVLLESVQRTHRLLVVQESWQCCGIGPWIVSMMLEEAFFELDAPPLVYSPPDTPVPFAPELENWYRPNTGGIINKLGKLLEF